MIRFSGSDMKDEPSLKNKINKLSMRSENHRVCLLCGDVVAGTDITLKILLALQIANNIEWLGVAFTRSIIQFAIYQIKPQNRNIIN